jgi:protein-arginine kinase activator protein McsA
VNDLSAMESTECHGCNVTLWGDFSATEGYCGECYAALNRQQALDAQSERMGWSERVLAVIVAVAWIWIVLSEVVGLFP